jgi:hypothetical protein
MPMARSAAQHACTGHLPTGAARRLLHRRPQRSAFGRGFLLSDGRFTRLFGPAALGESAPASSNERGEIVGAYDYTL